MYIKTRAGGCGKTINLYLNLIYLDVCRFQGVCIDTIDNNCYFELSYPSVSTVGNMKCGCVRVMAGVRFRR